MTNNKPNFHGVTTTLLTRTIKALTKLPYDDVAELIADLQQAPILDVRPNDPKKEGRE